MSDELREAAQAILDRCLDFFGEDDLDPESSEAMPVVIKNRWVYELRAALAARPDSPTLDDLRAAVELADMRADDGEVNPDGSVAEYVLSATDWNRVVAVARGHKSDAAERAIAPLRAARPPGPTLDERDPLVAVPRSLLLGAVDLWSNVHNALVWVPTEKNPRNGWGYFWARMHRLREAFNRPEHEQLRRVYEGSFGRGITENEPPTIDPNWDRRGPGATVEEAVEQ